MAEKVYSWKIEKYPVSAEVAAKEFDRIYEKYGVLDKKNIVEESRDKKAALHSCFEWDDAIAAEKYRQEQASDMVQCLVTVEKPDEAKEPIVVRAFVKTTEKYEPITVAIRSEEKYAVLLQDALNDAKWFQKKHGQLVELKAVFEAMNEFEKMVKEERK